MRRMKSMKVFNGLGLKKKIIYAQVYIMFLNNNKCS